MAASKQIKSAADLDYSSLPTQKRWINIRYITVGLGSSALFSLFISFTGSGVYSIQSESLVIALLTLFVAFNNLLVFPLMIATFVCGVLMFITTRDYLSKYIPGFALANNFISQANSYSINKDGAIFSYGDSPSESNIITGNYRGFEFELFQHRYWTGSGKSRSQHGLSIVNLHLPHKVPQLVIDSKIEDKSGLEGSVLPISFDKGQKLTLEGDFSRYFDVYSPRNYQVTALSLLTPDVMQTFLTKLHQVDVELVNDRLIIYDPDIMNSKEQIEDMFEAADAVINEWSAKLKRANIYANQSQVQIHTGAEAQPAKLNKSKITITTIFILVLMAIVYGANAAGEFIKNPIFITPMFIIVGLVAVAFVISQIIVARRRITFTKRYGKIKD